jgi:DNA replication and repair protein RecF
MILRSIEIKNFRNHIHTKIEFSDNLNLFVGGNAQGKTSILEAISYLCLTRSFNANSDSYVLNFNSNFFEVTGLFELQGGHETIVRVFFETGRGKKVFLNKENIEKFSIIINKFPVVILAPKSKEIVLGSPDDRRKFFDLTIAQSNPAYVDELIEHKKILRQRNKILNAISTGEIKFEQGLDLLEVWDESFINQCARITFRRLKFLSEFISFFKEAHSKFEPNENPDIEYTTQVDVNFNDNFDAIKEKFKNTLNKLKQEEIKRGMTLVGPQRDEFFFKINGHELRRFASQGQAKSFLISLVIAKFFYLKEKKFETPILILDDVFGEFDFERAQKLISMVGDIGQSFLTATDLNFVPMIAEGIKVKKFIVKSGTVQDA